MEDLISKKKGGADLTKEDITFFVDKIVNKKEPIEDDQVGEMLKAIYQQGLNEDETRFLTHAMTHSGEVLEWQEERNYKIVDKHSTGGVGDKTSLLLTPALAACGVKVPMVSGRGLGHTQGTLDKLESIPGFRVTLNTQEMRKILDEVGCFIAGQTEYFVPADKRMYAIRDVTGTINNDGLITGSIISKKAAESLDALVLDVKFGKAAFKKDDKSARNIATQMVKAGNGLGMKTAALLTDMDAPIGNMIGHVLEVVEAIKGPHWDGPEDLQDLVERLGGRALFLCGKVEGVQEGSQLIREKMQNGAAVNKFCEMLKAQGVESDLADRLCRRGTDVLKLLTSSKKTTKVLCQDTGYIHDIDGLKCADVIRSLGGCRTKAGENINLKIGLELTKHIGDQANKGEPWVIVHHDEDQLPDHIVDALNQAVVVKLTPCRKISCRIIDVISA